MYTQTEILGVRFDTLCREELTKKLNTILDSEGKGYLVTPNPEILMYADKDEDYREVLNCAELCIADGIGVVWAAKILKKPLKERVPGIEIGEEVLSLCAEKGIGVYFLGGKDGVAEKAAEKMQNKYTGLIVSGTHHGYFMPEEDHGIVNGINRSGAKVLFVCMGFPKQEKWICKNAQYLTDVRLALALGGSLDVYAGIVTRAPSAVRKAGAEWIWRSFSSRNRLRRTAKLPLFILRVFREKHGRKQKI